ncbi:MAG: LysM domain-containing protein [Syntrophomonas sp.]
MDIYLIDPSGPQLRIPVNPGEINVRREKLLDTINIISLGEIDFPHGEKVKEITFSSFFPADYDASYCSYPDIPDPQEAMNQLTAWTAASTPVRLIISDTIINTLVLVSSHTSIFKGGEPGDVYYDLIMRTWREVKVRAAAEGANASTGTGNVVLGAKTMPNRPDVKPVPKTYTVKAGDSLFKIAKMELGNGSKWQDIYAKNTATIGKKPELIQPGMKLVLA